MLFALSPFLSTLQVMLVMLVLTSIIRRNALAVVYLFLLFDFLNRPPIFLRIVEVGCSASQAQR